MCEKELVAQNIRGIQGNGAGFIPPGACGWLSSRPSLLLVLFALGTVGCMADVAEAESLLLLVFVSAGRSSFVLLSSLTYFNVSFFLSVAPHNPPR